jgi:hypothetical protein
MDDKHWNIEQVVVNIRMVLHFVQIQIERLVGLP